MSNSVKSKYPNTSEAIIGHIYFLSYVDMKHPYLTAKSCKILKWPYLAANHNGVSPYLFYWSGSAPCSISIWSESYAFDEDADCRAELPSLSSRSTGWPKANKHITDYGLSGSIVSPLFLP